MQSSQIPVKLPTIWASGAPAGTGVVTVPVPSQQGITPNAASWTDGYPPQCAQAGGWPRIEDSNGGMQMISAWARWQAAGAPIYYDSSYSANIGGYPNGAVIASTSTPYAFWQCLVDNNTTNPDTGGANWRLINFSARQSLTANTTYYVSTSGSDTTGNGSSGSPWATRLFAATWIQANIDLAGFNVIISVANGSYSDQLVVSGPFVGATGATSVTFSGSTSAIIATPGGTAFSNSDGSAYSISGFSISATGAGGYALSAGANSKIIFSGTSFGACGTAHMLAQNAGFISATGNYTIAGNSPIHLNATVNGNIQVSAHTITLSGSPAFSTAFAAASGNANIICSANTYSGAAGATTAPLSVSLSGCVQTSGQYNTTMPGHANAVVQTTGGQYT